MRDHEYDGAVCRPAGSMVRLSALLVVLALLSGCGGDDESGGGSRENATWDFRSPRTAADLGSEVDPFVELDGPAALRVVFPSGREVEGVFNWGVLGMTALPPTPGHESDVVNEVILLQGIFTDADELRASAEAFVQEWGPATFRGETIEEFVERFDAFMSTAPDGTDLNDFAPIGENVFAFGAETQDGIDPTWSPRFVSDGFTIWVSLAFDPGVP